MTEIHLLVAVIDLLPKTHHVQQSRRKLTNLIQCMTLCSHSQFQMMTTVIGLKPAKMFSIFDRVHFAGVMLPNNHLIISLNL